MLKKRLANLDRIVYESAVFAGKVSLFAEELSLCVSGSVNVP